MGALLDVDPELHRPGQDRLERQPKGFPKSFRGVPTREGGHVDPVARLVEFAPETIELHFRDGLQEVIQIAEVDVEGRLGYSGLACDAARSQVASALARQPERGFHQASSRDRLGFFARESLGWHK